MTHWMHPPELERTRRPADFDPALEGARHGLSPELSVLIWDRACADATDRAGRCNTEQARRTFHDLAARLAARGGRLRPGVGKLTRAGIAAGNDSRELRRIDALSAGVPGRRTMVDVEARRWSRIQGEPSAAELLRELGVPEPSPARDSGPAPRGPGELDALTSWLGAPRYGIAGSRDPGDWQAIQQVLDREGLVVGPEHLDTLAPLYGQSLPWTLSMIGGDARDALAQLIAHAEHHCAPSCSHPPAGAASSTPETEEVLDDITRGAVARTTGFDVGPVRILRDPSLAGRGGMAVGGAIHLEPDLAGDGRGREVRLHEAVHVAQTRLPGPVADREAVEAEAAAVAHAAARGEQLAPQLRADPGSAYGFDLGDLLPDMSPVDLLRKFAPDVAGFIDQGFDGLLEHLGDAANNAFQKILDGLGINKFVDGFRAVTAAVGPGSMVFGVLTGCCECLDAALEKLGGKLDQFLASEGAKKVQNAIGDAQEAQKDQVLDQGAGFFAFLQKVGGPVLGIIEKVADGIDWVKRKVGPLASKVWGFICSKLGLDASLPPLEAIKKKLSELWEKASAALAPLRNAISSAVDWLKNQSPLAPLFRLADDIKKLVASVKKLIAAKAKDAKTWLGTMAKDLAGTVFEPLLAALLAGRALLLEAADAVSAWFTTVLAKLGILEAWRSSIGFIQQIVATVQSFVGKVKAALTSIGKQVEQTLREIADACQKFYGAVKPLLDFVCGFAVAIAATMMGNLLALPLFFLSNLWLHVLPECYKEPLVDFCLKSFIKVVQWLPAKGLPIFALLKSATLAFLNQLLATPRDRKMKAMNVVASLFAGNAEFTLGLVVGIFKGLYDSTIGTVVFVFEAAIWLAQMGIAVASFAGRSIADIVGGGGLVDFMREAGESTAGVDDLERDLAGKGDASQPGEDAEEDVEEDAPVELAADELPDDTPDEDSDPANGGYEEPVLSGTEEPDSSSSGAGSASAPADENIDPLPPIPEDMRNGRALFDAIFKQGVSRKDLEELLTSLGTGLEAAAAKAGSDAAKALIDALLADGAPYRIGETVGRIIGVVVAEVTIAVLTGGAGLGKTAVTLTKFAVKFAKDLPKLMKAVKWVLEAVRPLLDTFKKLKKGIGGWAAKVAKYVDDLLEWGKKNIQKIVRAIKARLKGDKKPGNRPDKKPDKDAPDNKPGNPKDKQKREENLKIAAMRGAQGGWNRMGDLAGAVHQLGAVRSQLNGVKVRRVRGIRVELSLVSMGSGWKVKAMASKRGRRATAKNGEGWITRAHKTRERWYAIKSERRLHADIIDDAVQKFQRSDHKLVDLRAEYDAKKKQAELLQKEGQQRVVLKGVELKIELGPYNATDSEMTISTDFVITPNATTRLGVKTKLDQKEILEAAKKKFPRRLWTIAELEDLVRSLNYQVTDRNVRDGCITPWTRAGVVFRFQTKPRDPSTQYTFQEDMAGVRPTFGNVRDKYGYKNPDHGNPYGINILMKGHVRGTPLPPADNSMYNSTLPGSEWAHKSFPRRENGKTLAILGHIHPAVRHWNTEGHKQPKDANVRWNHDGKNYRGPEHVDESNREGGELSGNREHYLPPSKLRDSHESWWETT